MRLYNRGQKLLYVSRSSVYIEFPIIKARSAESVDSTSQIHDKSFPRRSKGFHGPQYIEITSHKIHDLQTHRSTMEESQGQNKVIIGKEMETRLQQSIAGGGTP